MADNLTTTDYNTNDSLPLCECEQFESGMSESYHNFNQAIILISLPVVALFGVVSNILNVVIYSKPQLCRSSGNVYLLALACSDFFVVILGGFTFWCDSGKTFFSRGDIISLINSVVLWSLPVGYIAQTASVYFTLVAAFDCYVIVCWRRATPIFCTINRAKQMITAVVVWSFAYNLVRFWTLETRRCLMDPSSYHNDSQMDVLLTEILEICATSLYESINSFYNVYLYLILMTMFPFMLLSILNALIIKNVQMRKRFFAMIYMRKFTVRLMGSNGSGEGSESGNESEENTITLIMVVLLFLACNTLALVVNMVENFFPIDPETLHYMADVSNFLVIFNSSANFIIYVKYTDSFRAVIVGWFQYCCTPTVKSRLGSDLSTELIATGSGLESQPLQVRITPMPNADVNYMSIVKHNNNGNGYCELSQNFPIANLHVTTDSDYYL